MYGGIPRGMGVDEFCLSSATPSAPFPSPIVAPEHGGASVSPELTQRHGRSEATPDCHRILRRMRVQACRRRTDGGAQDLRRCHQGDEHRRPHFVVRGHRRRGARPLQADDGTRQVQQRQGEDSRASTRRVDPRGLETPGHAAQAIRRRQHMKVAVETDLF